MHQTRAQLLVQDKVERVATDRLLAMNRHPASALTKRHVPGAATIFGGSRKFWDIAHEYCKHGIGAHLETFLPTVAKHNYLKAVGLQVPRHPALPCTLFQLPAASALSSPDNHVDYVDCRSPTLPQWTCCQKIFRGRCMQYVCAAQYGLKQAVSLVRLD